MISPSLRGRLKPLSLVDTLAFLRALNRRGLLSVTAEAAAIGLFLKEGRIVQAISSREGDRLTELLVRQGRLTPEQRDAALRRAAAGEKIGKALLADGSLTPRDLMEARRLQVTAIALSLFEWTAGDFLFIEGEDPPDAVGEVDLPILDVIVEGIRTVRSVGLFALRLGSPERVFAPVAEAERALLMRLEPHEDHVLKLVDGARTVAEVIALAEFPDAETQRALFLLAAIGAIIVRPAPGDDADAPAAFDEIVRRYNLMFGHVHEYLMREVGPIAEDLLWKSLGESRGAHPALFRDATLGGDGTLDPALLRENLEALRGRPRPAVLVEGLNELLYAELLAVRRTLGADHEGRLLRALRAADPAAPDPDGAAP